MNTHKRLVSILAIILSMVRKYVRNKLHTLLFPNSVLDSLLTRLSLKTTHEQTPSNLDCSVE